MLKLYQEGIASVDSQTLITDWVRVGSNLGSPEYCVKGQLLRSRLNIVASGVLISSISCNASFEEVKHQAF